MIVGIGIDLVEVERLAKALRSPHGPQFEERVFTADEKADCAARGGRGRIECLAARFAAKEACLKALGTGFAHGMWIRDVGITANRWGRPEVIWSERGRRRRDELGAGEGHVTLTDEAGLVIAVAVLMRRADGAA